MQRGGKIQFTAVWENVVVDSGMDSVFGRQRFGVGLCFFAFDLWGSRSFSWLTLLPLHVPGATGKSFKANDILNPMTGDGDDQYSWRRPSLIVGGGMHFNCILQ